MGRGDGRALERRDRRPRVDGFTASHRGGSGTPLVCVHGFLDTWRTWELLLPALERHHDVLTPTLPGHAGGPPLREPLDAEALVDALESAMDAAGFATAHVIGNSLGGRLAFELAVRGRARSVVAFAPAGGWSDPNFADALIDAQRVLHDQLQELLPALDQIVASPEGRRRATELIVEHYEHLPPDLIVHLIRGAAGCDARPLLELARRAEWAVDAEAVTCPTRIVWGDADKVLPWPEAAMRYREWLPHADYVVLDGVGHCPQLDVPLEAVQLVLGVTQG
jgi:pimeloyl-ACP methyl ester carboxylesterase